MRVKIAVLCGGLSPERDVSLSTGRRVTLALKNLGHRAVMLDMYLGLEGYTGSAEEAFDLPLPASAGGIGLTEPDLDEIRRMRRTKSRSLFGERVLEVCAAADTVFMALHGRCGEDGRVQAAFDLLGIRYTGSGYLASAAAMDKRLAKLVAREAGALTPRWRYFDAECPPEGEIELPCVVKPVDSGSSLGVEIVRERRELPAAIARAMRESAGILIEDYIEGREIQISVLDGKALPSIEIIPAEGFYGYEQKYQPGAAIERTPADITPEQEASLASAAELIYRELGLRALARADFILDDEGRFWFLEFNTLPGMTPTSLAPQEAEAAGMSYEELCGRIVALSLEEDRQL